MSIVLVFCVGCADWIASWMDRWLFFDRIQCFVNFLCFGIANRYLASLSISVESSPDTFHTGSSWCPCPVISCAVDCRSCSCRRCWRRFSNASSVLRSSTNLYKQPAITIQTQPQMILIILKEVSWQKSMFRLLRTPINNRDSQLP